MRRFFLLLAVCMIAACASRDAGDQGQANRKPVPDDAGWSVFRGNSELTGVADGGLPNSLKLLWTFKTDDAVRSSPVVGSGRVYIGSYDGKRVLGVRRLYTCASVE